MLEAKPLTAHSGEELMAVFFQLWTWSEPTLLRGLPGFKVFQQELKGGLRSQSFFTSLVLTHGELIQGCTHFLFL